MYHVYLKKENTHMYNKSVYFMLLIVVDIKKLVKNLMLLLKWNFKNDFLFFNLIQCLLSNKKKTQIINV